jgi:hypothetical protein
MTGFTARGTLSRKLLETGNGNFLGRLSLVLYYPIDNTVWHIFCAWKGAVKRNALFCSYFPAQRECIDSASKWTTRVWLNSLIPECDGDRVDVAL